MHQYRGSFQAPNWTHDGKALIYAQEGRLYRFDLASRSPQVINTGFATRNNNDHVLSFDGRTLAISHHAAEDSGASIVYTVPTTGGTPKRVTAKGPSYLHGWSPDGRWLVYVGQRNDEFDIYRISVNGGDEIRLTSAPGLDDGPEYTPDGKYIYFNSVRSGRMQIWRMRPDGSNQEQITNDSFNNWFPHISPDGKSMVFISFPLDVPANDDSLDAGRWRTDARYRLCVWRTGNDQRPFVVARRKAIGVREQFNDALTAHSHRRLTFTG